MIRNPKDLKKGDKIHQVWWTAGEPQGELVTLTVVEFKEAGTTQWIVARSKPDRTERHCMLTEWSLTETEAWSQFLRLVEQHMLAATKACQDAASHAAVVFNEYLRVRDIIVNDKGITDAAKR